MLAALLPGLVCLGVPHPARHLLCVRPPTCTAKCVQPGYAFYTGAHTWPIAVVVADRHGQGLSSAQLASLCNNTGG